MDPYTQAFLTRVVPFGIYILLLVLLQNDIHKRIKNKSLAKRGKLLGWACVILFMIFGTSVSLLAFGAEETVIWMISGLVIGFVAWAVRNAALNDFQGTSTSPEFKNIMSAIAGLLTHFMLHGFVIFFLINYTTVLAAS